MAALILFHHAQGLTPGVHAYADHLRAAGHHVAVPDLYEGATFDTIEAGVAHAKQIGFDTVIERGVAAAAGLPDDAVYAGFSLGVLPAQRLAQTRPGALAALLYHDGVPAATFGGPWPDQVALQVHLATPDEWSDLDAAEALVADAADAELFVYPGSTHLFTDASLGGHDADATALVLQRTIELLDRWS